MAERNKSNFEEYYDIIGIPIGNGSYGTVHKGKEKETNEFRVIKIIEIKQLITELSYLYNGKELKDE